MTDRFYAQGGGTSEHLVLHFYGGITLLGSSVLI